MSLTEKVCLPCQGGMPPLTREEAEKIGVQTPEWSLPEDATRISRSFRFSDFAEAQTFVNKVGDLAEAEGHHPDISFGWGYADIVLYTHKINGLHENDFILAAKIDQL
jgi:4a-hydroxytetrahydrobiopterin dehydratase